MTYASIQALQPDLIINAGTAGGFKVQTLQNAFFFLHKFASYVSERCFFCYGLFQAKGASLCDVYIVSSSSFHDRRIPVPVSALLY